MAKSVKDPATIVALRGLALVEPAATPTRARSTKGPMRAPARGKAPPDVGAAIAASLEGQELELAMEKTLARKPEAPAVPKRQRQARGAALAPAAVERPGFSLDVPLADGEDAVVLLEEDGVFSWHLLGEEVTPPEVHRDLVRQRAVTGRKLASASARRRVKRFTVNVGTTVPVARTPAAKGPVRQRGLVSFITDTVVGKVVARVVHGQHDAVDRHNREQPAAQR